MPKYEDSVEEKDTTEAESSLNIEDVSVDEPIKEEVVPTVIHDGVINRQK